MTSSSSKAASSLPSSSSSSSTSTTTKTVLGFVSAYVGSWGVYYLAQSTVRRRAIKKRKQKHERRIAGKQGHSKGQSTSQSTTALTHQEQVDAIQERFGTLSVLGRYCNPFPEWREQGAWEFVIWKTWYFFTTGKLWSDGGVAKLKKTPQGKQRILDTLPSSTPSWSEYQKKSLDGGDSSPKSPDEDSWAELSKSELNVKSLPKEAGHASDDKIHYTWIGQSTMLVSYANLNILTDPVFGEQPVVSKVSPTRITPTPCDIKEIVSNVDLDVVVVSHNHYDHFDADVVPHIPEDVLWIVPLGMRGLLTSVGKKRQDKIVELNWWEIKDLQFDSSQGSLRVQSIPAMHWSARTPLDTNQSLWTSYSLQITPPKQKAAQSKSSVSRPAHIYFSGDTGYSPTFFPHLSTIFSTPPHLAFLPIGSYLPRWHMSPQHVSPADSVQIAKDIRARKVVGMHWGTWIMSDEEWDEPPRLLREELRKEGLEKKQGQEHDWFAVVNMGETNELVVRD